MSQAQKLGYGIDEMVHALAVRDSKVGLLTDVQAGWHNSTAHAQGFSTLKRMQMIVKSLGDIIVILLM